MHGLGGRPQPGAWLQRLRSGIGSDGSAGGSRGPRACSPTTAADCRRRTSADGVPRALARDLTSNSRLAATAHPTRRFLGGPGANPDQPLVEGFSGPTWVLDFETSSNY